MKVIETDLYGSDRLGLTGTQTVATAEQTLSGFGTVRTFTFTRGEKSYELTNHLGNVLSTISDRRQQMSTNNSTVSFYMAEVTSATDYYPFGMQMPGRTLSSSSYRYGFNGKENDNDVKGDGNQQDYGMRIYDPRIGRFLSTDPLTAKYPFYTPYQYAGNTPIQATDLDGTEQLNATTPGGKKTALMVMGTSAFIFNAIQSSTNTNFDQVYAYTQTNAATLNESEINSYKSLVGRVRGAYGEGVAEYLTISAMQVTFEVKGELPDNITVKTKKTSISEDNSDLKPGQASFGIQKAGFDFLLEFRCGPKGEGIFSKRATLTNFFENADGTPDVEIYFKDEKKVFGIEIKTYDPKNVSINMKGFEEAADQIVKAYNQNNGKVDGGVLVPVLQTDEEAWRKAYEKNPNRMQKVYDKINKAHGKLQLITGLYQGATDRMQQTKRQVNATGN